MSDLPALESVTRSSRAHGVFVQMGQLLSCSSAWQAFCVRRPNGKSCTLFARAEYLQRASRTRGRVSDLPAPESVTGSSRVHGLAAQMGRLLGHSPAWAAFCASRPDGKSCKVLVQKGHLQRASCPASESLIFRSRNPSLGARGSTGQPPRWKIF